jgi:hypothetical protein
LEAEARYQVSRFVPVVLSTSGQAMLYWTMKCSLSGRNLLFYFDLYDSAVNFSGGIAGNKDKL